MIQLQIRKFRIVGDLWLLYSLIGVELDEELDGKRLGGSRDGFILSLFFDIS